MTRVAPRWNSDDLRSHLANRGQAAAPRSKYRNKKTVVDGVKFDSKVEARRFVELSQMQAAGLIANLRRQVAFELAPPVKIHGAARASPALRYFADFVYDRDGAMVIEDVKGVVTEAYRVKRHLMAALGHQIVEVRKSASHREKAV